MRQQGFIWPMVLILLGLLSSSVLSLLQTEHNYLHAVAQLLQKQQLLDDMESAAFVVLRHPQSVCHTLQSNPQQWSSVLAGPTACDYHSAKYHYRYTLSDLGSYPCLRLVMQQHLRSSHHWLIHLEHATVPQQTLEIRVAVADTSNQPCLQTHSTVISAGVLSWHLA